MLIKLTSSFLLLSCLVLSPVNVSAAEVKYTFNKDIRPILAETCFACHGQDKNALEADLRMDLRDVAVEMKAIVPGKQQRVK